MFYKTVVEDALILHNQDSLDATIAGSFQEIYYTTIVYRAWDDEHLWSSLNILSHLLWKLKQTC